MRDWLTGDMTAPPPPARTAAGPWLVIAGAVLWGTTGSAQALGPADASPLAVGATRLVVGGALLVAYAVVLRLAIGARSTIRRAQAGTAVGGPPPDRRTLVLSGLIGAAAVATYQATFFAAVDVAGVALGTAVAIGSAPVSTGLIEWGLRHRPPPGRWWLATTTTTAGVVILAGPSQLVLSGVLLALGAGLSYAVYATASKSLLDAGIPGPTAMAVVFGGGGLLLLPVLPTLDLGWLATAEGIALVAWLGGATILVAYLLFAAGLSAVPASTAATLSLAEPLTAAILGVVLLAERPSSIALVGAAAMLVGLAVLVAPSSRRQPLAS